MEKRDSVLVRWVSELYVKSGKFDSEQGSSSQFNGLN